MFSLESPHRGNSNEYTQYTIFNINTKNHPKLSEICSYEIVSKGLKNAFETMSHQCSSHCNSTVVQSLSRWHIICHLIMCCTIAIYLNLGQTSPKQESHGDATRKKTPGPAAHFCDHRLHPFLVLRISCESFHFNCVFHRNSCKQTVLTLFRCHILWHLNRVCIVHIFLLMNFLSKKG